MPKDYVPRSHGNCFQWLQGLSTNLSQNWSAYGVSQADAANLAARVADLQAAMAVAGNEATRTKASILARDQQRAVAVNLARLLCQQVKRNLGVSAELMLRAGIPLPRAGGYTPLGPPNTRPALSIAGNTYLSQTIRFSDESAPSRRGRPFGVKACFLFLSIGDEPSRDPTTATLVDGFPRGPVAVSFKPEHKGKTATYWACWVSPRLERGPLSNPVSLMIAA